MKKWFAINYNLPTEPSRARVSVWRKLKKLGAVNIQQSMWVLPHVDAYYKALGDIAKEIENSNGDCLLMEISFTEEKYEQVVINTFNKARTLEYEEIIDKCNDFFVEIEDETKAENFTFAEAEENEEELAKLLSWFEKIKARDLFQAPSRKETETILQKCREVFEDFSHRVYENEK